MKNMFIGIETYMFGKLRLSSIFRHNCRLDQSIFACGVPCSLCLTLRSLPPRREDSLKSLLSTLRRLWNASLPSVSLIQGRYGNHRFFHFSQSFRPKTMAGQERCPSWISMRPSLNSLHLLRTCCTLIHFCPYTSHSWEWMSTEETFFAHKKTNHRA